MDAETKQTITIMAREIAQEMCRSPGTAMLPASPTVIQACGTITPTNGCEGLLYAPITTFRFLRSGRTNLNIVTSGQIPVLPGTSIVPCPRMPTHRGHRLLQPALPSGQRQRPRPHPDRVAHRR